MADLSIGKIPKAIGSTQIGDSIITDNGVSGVTVAGALLLGGSTSGSVALRVPAIAGTSSITFPSGTTNFTTSGGAGMVLQQATLGGPITVAALAPSSLGGLGAGVATWLATPSSANLLAAVTDETGSGALVFANSPVLAGNPTAPTPALSDSDTSIATTAYVKGQNYIAGNQSITLSGDVSGTGTTAIAVTLNTVLSTPGTFQGLTVNNKGLVTAAANMNYATTAAVAGAYVPLAGSAIVTPGPLSVYGSFPNSSTSSFRIGDTLPLLFGAGGAGAGLYFNVHYGTDGSPGWRFANPSGATYCGAYTFDTTAQVHRWWENTSSGDPTLYYEMALKNTRLVIGTWAGHTNAFPAITSAGNQLQVVLADGSGFAPIWTGALSVGAATGTARVYNSYTDAANGEWAYLGDWGSSNVARYGTDRNGTGAARPLIFTIGGVNMLDYGYTTSMYPNVWTTPSAVVVGATTPTTYQLNGISFNQYYNSGFLYAPGSASHHAGMYSFDVASGAHIWWSTTTPGNAGASAASLATMMAVKKNTTVGGPMLAFGDWVDYTAAFPALRRNGTALEVRLADDSAYAPLRAGDLVAAGNLTVGTTAATARTFRLYTDASNGEWCYLGDWGVTAGVATFGTSQNGSGAARPVAIMAGGAEAIRISTLKEITLNFAGTGTALFTVAGSYNTNPTVAHISTTMNSTSTAEHRLLLIRGNVSPAGATLTSLYGSVVDPTLTGSSTAVGSFNAYVARTNIAAATAATVTNSIMYMTLDPVMNSNPAFGLWAGFHVGTLTHGNGATTGTIANRGFNVSTISAGSAGATLTNRAFNASVPSGGASAGTTQNAGIYLTGNGGTASGSGVVTNYAIYSDSSAMSLLRGLRVGLSTGTANATTAVEPYLYITASAGTPTGVPRDAAAGSIAIQWDSTAKKLWVYDQPAGNWKGVVLA